MLSGCPDAFVWYVVIRFSIATVPSSATVNVEMPSNRSVLRWLRLNRDCSGGADTPVSATVCIGMPGSARTLTAVTAATVAAHCHGGVGESLKPITVSCWLFRPVPNVVRLAHVARY